MNRDVPLRVRQVACPNCGTGTDFAPSNPWRPFCSERCRAIDFGAWASETYRIAAVESDGEELPAPDGEAAA